MVDHPRWPAHKTTLPVSQALYRAIRQRQAQQYEQCGSAARRAAMQEFSPNVIWVEVVAIAMEKGQASSANSSNHSFMIIHSILPSSESRRKLLLLPEMSCYYQRCPDCHPVHILTVILS